MNKLLIFTITILLGSSCVRKHEGEQKTSLLSNFISISDNEDKGVKEILSFYGGYCEYSLGASASASTETEKKKYFELKLTKSELIEELANKVEMVASNSAYLFYKNLTEEREKYDEIHVLIGFKDGDEMLFKYSTDDLEKIDKRIELVEKIVGLIKDKEFEAIRPYLNTELFDYSKDELISGINRVDSQFGKVTDGFMTYGFRIRTMDNGKQILHQSCVILRDVQNHEFSLDIDLNSDKEEIYLLQYKL